MKKKHRTLSLFSLTVLSLSLHAKTLNTVPSSNCDKTQGNKQCQYTGNISSLVNESNSDGSITVNTDDANFSDRAGFSTEGKNNNINITATDSTFGASIPSQGSFNLTASEGTVSLNADNITTTSSVLINGNAGNDISIKNSTLGSDGSRSLYVYQQSNSNEKMGNSDIDVSNSTLSDTLLLQTRGDTILSVEDNSTLNGVRNINSGLESDTQAHFENSIAHGDINIQATYGNAFVSLDNMTLDQQETDDQSQLQVTSGGIAQVQVLNSAIAGGVYVASYPRTDGEAGEASLTIENSQIEQYSPTSSAVKVVADGDTNTSAAIDIKSSKVTGDVVAESEAADQNATITLDNTDVSGNIKIRADDMVLNLNNNAAFSGQLDVSDYYTDDEEPGTTTNTTVNVNNDAMSNNITNSRGGDGADNTLTINVNQGAIIGGNSVENAMQLTGFDDVNVNINYVDPALINSGVDKYFYIDDSTVQVNGVIDDHGTLSAIRDGAYVYNKVQYHVTDDTAQQSVQLPGDTYAVSFTTDDTPQVASDIQAAKAGLLASDDMLHRIVSGIGRQLDMRAQSTDDQSHVWTQALYGSDDRDAGKTQYSNNISGGQIGADVPIKLRNGDILSVGGAYAHAYNNLKLRDGSGHNHINGDYYSAYLRLNAAKMPQSGIRWFIDNDFTWASMRYNASESEGDLSGGGHYSGSGFLWQTRVGAVATPANSHIWLQPYLSLGYSQIRTDSFNDGYTDIDNGKENGFYTGVGTRIGTSLSTSNGIVFEPYIDANYTAQLDNNVDFSADEYNFDGENKHIGQIGIGNSMAITPKLIVNASFNTIIGQDVEHGINSDLSVLYTF